MRRHAGRNGGDFFSQTLPLTQGDRGLGGIGPLLANKGRPVHSVLALEVGQYRVHRVFARIHGSAKGFDHVIAERGPQTLRCQLVGVQAARSGVSCNFLVHQRLRQRGCVLLIVAELAETNDVHHHVLAKLQTELKRQLSGQHHSFRVIAVHMHHRRLDHLDHISAIQCGAAVAWIAGGETDLVVDDDMHRATRGVTPGFSQCKGFHVDTLARKGRVAMHQHRQHLLAERVSAAIHAGAH